jgi:DNA-binding SARP family transcriptional activator
MFAELSGAESRDAVERRVAEQLHAAAGDRAEALRVFAKCRELLRDELGVSPSPQTEAVYLKILRAE